MQPGKLLLTLSVVLMSRCAPVFGQHLAAVTRAADSLLAQSHVVEETDVPRAQTLARRAHQLLHRAGAPADAQAHALLQIGACYLYEREYAPAARLAQRALAVADSVRAPRLIGECLNVLGSIYIHSERWALARRYLRRAVAIQQLRHDAPRLAAAYANLATAYDDGPHVDSSTYYYQQALPLLQGPGDSVTRALVHNNLANNFLLTHRYAAVLTELAVAERSQPRHARDGTFAANVAFNRGVALLALQQPAAALTAFQAGLAAAANDPEAQIGLYEQLAVAYERTGQLRAALTAHRRYSALRASLLGSEQQAALSALHVRYETAQRDAAIKRLRQTNHIAALQLTRQRLLLALGLAGLLVAVLVGALLWVRYRAQQRTARLLGQANDRLATANQALLDANTALGTTNQTLARTVAEKQTLMQEIHHRVKNNLQLISSLLSWQRRSATDAATLHALDASRARVGSMALIHEYLYLSENIAHIDSRAYLGKLLAFLARTYSPEGRIRLHPALAEIRLSTKQTVPLGLIVNELLSNAFKYAFPVAGQAGNVWVSFALTADGGGCLQVTDDGVGLPPAVLTGTSTPGAGRSSLGLQLVRLLTQQLDGTFRAAPGPDGGAQFTITFPLAPADTVETALTGASAVPTAPLA